MTVKITRRTAVAGMAGSLVVPSRAFAQGLTLPKSPVTINVVDVAGNLALTQQAIESYRAAKPKLVSKVTFTKAPAPELPGKIKAQQDAGRVDIDVVLTGTDALSAGVEQRLWSRAAPEYAAKLAQARRHLPARRQARCRSWPRTRASASSSTRPGRCSSTCPTGSRTPPTTAEELLAWAKANPGRFIYARPANSGPGRTFMMGLPYILGDKDPKDPINGWDKTWAYLKELGQYIEYYPPAPAPR